MNAALTTADRKQFVARRVALWTPRVLPVLMFLAVASPVLGQPDIRDTRWRPDDRAFGNLVDVQVQVEGRTAPLYVAPNELDRRYFEAFHGQRYALRVQNRTGERIGVLIAVDGLNVVNGQRTALRNTEPMYVLDPWESATIRGWRTSLEQVREFVFVDETRSYANRTGQANGDMGWIRVLAFHEQPDVTRFRPYDEPRLRGGRDERGRGSSETDAARPQAQGELRSEGAGEPLAKATPPAPASPSLEDARQNPQSLDEAFPGTGWGNRRRDRVRRVQFDPVRVASDHIVLRYEYASGLVALGIFPDRDRLRDRVRGELTFARPPRW